MIFVEALDVIITKKGVGTLIMEIGERYGDQTGYLSGSVDPA